MSIVYRQELGRELTWSEADNNFAELKAGVDSKKSNFDVLPATQGGTGQTTVDAVKVAFDIATKTELASSAAGKGAELVEYQGATVEAALNERLPEIGNYALLRAYTGPVTAFYVRGVANVFDGGFGVFRVDAADTTTADNGGTVLVDASGRRWKRVYSGALVPAWFGAVGDGIANDKSEITAMLTAAGTTNIVIDWQGRDYFVGDVSESSGPVFTLTECSGVTFINPGKFFVTNNYTLSDVGVSWAALFKFIDCERIDIDVNAVGSAFNKVYPKGVTAVEIQTTQASTKIRGYKIRSRLENGVAALEVNRPYSELTGPLTNPAMATDFVIDVGSKNAEYGARFVGNGVSVHGVINTESVGRAYFPVDTYGHKVFVNSTGHNYITDVLIKSYFADVSDIHVWYSGKNFTATGGNALTLEFQNDTQNTSIKRIHANIDIDGFGDYQPVIISRQMSAAGAIQSTTNSVTDDIFLSLTCPQSYNVDTIHVSSTPASGGTVHLDGKYANVKTTNGLTFKRGNDFICNTAGDFSAGNNVLTFHVDGLYLEQGAYAELEIWADANYSIDTKEAYQKWSGRLYVNTSGGGNFVSINKETEKLFNGIVAPTIAFVSMSGFNLKISVTCADCNNADARLHGRLRLLCDCI